MSNREIRMLNPDLEEYPGGLRSGRPRHNSTTLAPPGIAQPDISSITVHQNTPDHTPGPFNRTAQSFYESPLGRGIGTSIQPGLNRQIRPTECTTEIEFEREYERLFVFVQTFGLDHANTEGWMGTIDEAYMETIDVIENFRATLTMSKMDKLLVKADQLDEMATTYKDELYRRAEDERAIPTFSAVNLSNRLSVVDTEDRRDPDQHTRNEQDTTIQPGNSSTPTNPLDGVELQLNSNNDIEIIGTSNILQNELSTANTLQIPTADLPVPVPGADLGALPRSFAGTDTYNQQSRTERGGGAKEIIS